MITKEVYEQTFGNVIKVYNIFKEYYGEERVDLQKFPTLDIISNRYPNCSIDEIRRLFSCFDILIHFPKVKITNEYDKFVFAEDIFVKVSLLSDGRLVNRFKMNRTTYPLSHFQSGYMHSHCPGITYNNLSVFQTPCTGTGPINGTISSLICGFDEDLWSLFCLELDKYVPTESIAGTPYRRLESISTGTNYPISTKLYHKVQDEYLRSTLGKNGIKRFFLYLINSDFIKLRFINGFYSLAYSEQDIIILLSNIFIEWYNNELKLGVSVPEKDLIRNICVRCVLLNNILVENTRSSSNVDNLMSHNGRYMFDFKGKPINLKLYKDKEDVVVNEVLILRPCYVEYFVSLILDFINYNYGKSEKCDFSKKVKFL